MLKIQAITQIKKIITDNKNFRFIMFICISPLLQGRRGTFCGPSRAIASFCVLMRLVHFYFCVLLRPGTCDLGRAFLPVLKRKKNKLGI